MAGSYHAGKFLRPHGKTGKVYFPEDGTVYFKANAMRAMAPSSRLPIHMLEDRDILRELGDAKDAWRPMPGWCCCTTLCSGTQHPEATVANAFGDRYVYSLCPSHPDARAYADRSRARM